MPPRLTLSPEARTARARLGAAVAWRPENIPAARRAFELAVARDVIFNLLEEYTTLTVDDLYDNWVDLPDVPKDAR